MTVFSTDSSESESDPLTSLARFLRQGVGQEWRAEAEAMEFETNQHRLRRRTIHNVIEMLLHRGDLLTILTGGLKWTGQVVGCGEDYLTLRTHDLGIDARMDRVALVVTRRSSGGMKAQGTAPTWRARLQELELSAQPLELHGPSFGNPRSGIIRAVSVDHIWLVEPAGLESYLPIGEVAVVVRRLPTTSRPSG